MCAVFCFNRENSSTNQTAHEEFLSACSSVNVDFGAGTGEIIASLDGNISLFMHHE